MQSIVNHARDEQAHEACGIIAGQVGVASRIIPISNVATNAQYHYQMDAQELLQALKAIDAADEDMLAVYHSHPNSEAIPSLEDVREAELNTPNIVHLIISLKYGKARLQAWRIHDGKADRVELLIGNQMSANLEPLSQTQIIAIILATILAVAFLLMISFYLLPLAPPIPTPQ
jgi:proteasome lid subunit RPN8/RPN11